MKILPIFLLLLIPLSSAYPLRNLSNDSIYSNNSINVNVSYPDNYTKTSEIIDACFNVSSQYNYTIYDSMIYFFNMTNFSYTLTPITCNYGAYNISGNYEINGTIINSSITYITYYSPYINLYRKYDTNNNSLISKDEVLNSVWDYFNNLLTNNEISNIIDKYSHPLSIFY